MHKQLSSEQGVKMIGKHKHNLLSGPITALRRKSPGFEVAICFLSSHFTNSERKAHGVSLVWLSESTNVVHGKLKCQITRAILLPQSHACWLLTKCVPESRKALAPLEVEGTRRRAQINGLDLHASASCLTFEYYSMSFGFILLQSNHGDHDAFPGYWWMLIMIKYITLSKQYHMAAKVQ